MAESSHVRCKRHQAGSRQSFLQAIVAVLLAGSTFVWSMTFLPSKEVLQRHLSVPEEMLVKALMEIGENRIGAALDQIDRLLSSKPDFRLAQLIKGDLLLARTRPIDTVGAGAASATVADLREEARARLERYTFQPPTDLAPIYLLELPPEQKYALILDASKSTLFVFENREDGPHYVTDYYVSVGKSGVDKVREGDKRTPLGVYHVTGKLSRDKLTDFYGTGAFPINYPNEWDRIRGRSGYGIWLHGTPLDTYSRPPRASDGCMVLANEDLNDLEKYLQLGSTPVIIADRIQWADGAAIAKVRDELTRNLESWRKDWESLDTETYLHHYAKQFSADGVRYAQWAAQKRLVNSGKTWIKVGISDTSMILYPGDSSLAVVTFEQDYASSNLVNTMRKRQYWIRESGHWKILYEGAA